MLERIRGMGRQLSPSQARVAEWLLAQPHAFVQSAVAEIAQGAGVSQPTVVRFCRAMGASGLKTFKLQLAASLQENRSGLHPSVLETDPLPDLSAKVVSAAVDALQSLSRSVDLSALQSVVQAMSQARRIDFVGVGQSALVAQDAKQKFFRFGLFCEAHADPAMQVMSAAQLGPGDLLVLISASGRSPELTDVAELAKGRGVAIVSVGAPGSPVDRYASWCLHAHPADDPDLHMPMLGRLQHLLLIDILAVALAQHVGDPARAKLLDLKRISVQRRSVPPTLVGAAAGVTVTA